MYKVNECFRPSNAQGVNALARPADRLFHTIHGQ